MNQTRLGGVLLHPTSFPGQHGIGDIGPAATEFIDFLVASGLGLWQVLPLNPTGYGDSPYQCFSAFAGNPYLISPEELLEEGLIEQADLDRRPTFPSGRVDFGRAIPWKLFLLERALTNRRAHRRFQGEFSAFAEGTPWLADFAEFMALKEEFGGAPWVDWPEALRRREASAMKEFRRTRAGKMEAYKFTQFLFFRHWGRLREYAREHRVYLIGDIPIYVAHDSADVWANPELFLLDDYGNPTVLAGVPPDYFSEFGQLWGNPIYHWERMAADGYSWWVERTRATLKTVDFIRLDHFRGFAGYWEVPAGEVTAVKGRWVPGPGASLFSALERSLGRLPLIAEDLGEITPDVIELREMFGYPGMRIMQFGFSGNPDHEFLPHTYPENCVAYTGTHDNETVVSWYKHAEERHRKNARIYLGSDGAEIHWDMIKRLWASPARMVLAQMQDFLGIGDEGRMNLPSRPSGNWQWRYRDGDLTESLAERLRELSAQTGRLAG